MMYLFILSQPALYSMTGDQKRRLKILSDKMLNKKTQVRFAFKIF